MDWGFAAMRFIRLAALKFVTLVLASLKPVALVFRLPLAGIGQPEIRQKGRV